MLNILIFIAGIYAGYKIFKPKKINSHDVSNVRNFK